MSTSSPRSGRPARGLWHRTRREGEGASIEALCASSALLIAVTPTEMDGQFLRRRDVSRRAHHGSYVIAVEFSGPNVILYL
jgi:hypothetical protein